MSAGLRQTGPHNGHAEVTWRQRCAESAQGHTCPRCGRRPGPPCGGGGNCWERYGAAYRNGALDIAAFAGAATRRDAAGIVPGTAT